MKVVERVRGLEERRSLACLRHRCYFFSHQLYFVCVVHPEGVETEHGLDFKPDPNAVQENDELWEK